jgi:hypothetical protein
VIPALAAMTPRLRSSGVSRAIRLYAPRILKLKIGCVSSRFNSTWLSRRRDRRGATSSAVSLTTS